MPSRVFHSLEEGIVSGSGSFYVARFGVLFPVFLNLKVRNYSEYPFVILVPGTTRRGNPLPIFQRSSYSESIHGNVLVLADPTLNFDENMNAGWFFGDTNYHYAEIISNIIAEAFCRLLVSNVVVYTTSAGGIPGVLIANKIKKCKCYISNAQFNVFNYYSRHKNILFQSIFGCLDELSIMQQFGKRINLCNNFINECKLIVAQNIHDEFHYLRHFLPFVDRAINNNALICLTYEDEQSGHNVLSKEEELAIINYLADKSELEVFSAEAAGRGDIEFAP